MFIVSVCLRQSPTTLQFMFKEWAPANHFRQMIHRRRRATETEEAKPEDAWSLEMRDDYGHVFDCLIEEIGAVILKDCKASGQASIDLSLLNARQQAELQAQVQRDPKIRFMQGAGGLQLPTNG